MSDISWETFFKSERQKPYFQKLENFLMHVYDQEVVYPERENVFKAFELTLLSELKVVIFGQDPYINAGEATGLAFSVNEGVKIPPSLRNIYKEIENNVQYKIVQDGNLDYLAAQGVLLINPILTVRKGYSLSHDFAFYQTFTKNLITFLDTHQNSLVYLLWGNRARELKHYIKNKNHLVLESVHPSPLAANRGGFFNEFHFNKANVYLKAQQMVPIVWGKKAK
ncbi:MAG TPA: uracil-DNA glycosylase [Bacilli bacterium]|nr:uracil-DNA glycosylase [Bacilli bacterium]